MTKLYAAAAGTVEYRYDQRGDRTVLLMHGGHMRAELSGGEEYFARRGYSVVAVSRPGYGRTSQSLHRQVGAFEVAVAELLDALGISQVLVIGVSAGGRAAMRFAERYPDQAKGLILLSALSFQQWPSLPTRMAAYLLFNPAVEAGTWAMMRWCVRHWPSLFLVQLMGSLTTLPARQVIAELDKDRLEAFRSLVCEFRSKRGFMNDMSRQARQGNPEDIQCPTLIIHSRYDGSVPLRHAEENARRIPRATLRENDTESHLMWLSRHWSEDVEPQLDDFLHLLY